jgi:putative endonuclease
LCVGSNIPDSVANRWYVYLVACADGSLYTGVTRVLSRRIAAHNAGKAARYTRARRPVQLVYAEPAGDRAAAQRREAEIKRWKRPRKLALIETGSGSPP